MALNLRKFLEGIKIVPKASTTIDTQGELEVLSSNGKIQYHNGTTASPIVTAAHAESLTNKTIDADLNTISNIDNADIKTGAAIDRAKLASGTADHVIINNGSGVLSSEATLAKSRGGSGQDNSSLTFPASGTLATLAGTESFSNKKFTDSIQLEDPGAGTNKITIQAPTLAGDYTLTLPVDDGSADQVLKTDGSGTTSWVAATPMTTNGDLIYQAAGVPTRLPIGSATQVLTVVAGAPAWAASGGSGSVRSINAQTGTSYTTVIGDAQNIVTLTNAAAITLTVPTNASVAYPTGTEIFLIQGGAGQVTVVGDTGVTVNALGGGLLTLGQYTEVKLVKYATNTWFLVESTTSPGFITATGGDSIITDGNFKAHVFNNSGTFTVVSGVGNVEYLIIAGGGSGGSAAGGGGGAGGYRTGTQSSVVAGGYAVTVGAGGAGVASGLGNDGSNSSVFSISSAGGGAGSSGNANNGGSGGGGGTGGTPSTGGTGTVGQGNDGGDSPGGGVEFPCGGGGGASAVGADGAGSAGGAGGAGTASSITGSAVTRAGGGGGTAKTTLGAGGTGGGGNGANQSTGAVSGTANTGGGGGGGYLGTSGAGGSGVVILRYQFQA